MSYGSFFFPSIISSKITWRKRGILRVMYSMWELSPFPEGLDPSDSTTPYIWKPSLLGAVGFGFAIYCFNRIQDAC